MSTARAATYPTLRRPADRASFDVPVFRTMRGGPDVVAVCVFACAGAVHATGIASDLTYPLITSGAVVLTFLGLRRHRPAVMWPWISLLVVGALWTIAGVLRDWTEATGDLSGSRSFLPDLFALPGYALFGVAIFGFVKRRNPVRDVDVLLDAVLLTAGAGLIAHEVLIGPTLDLADTAIAARWAIAIYPAISICLLVFAAQISFARTARRSGYSFIVAGTFCLVLGDLVFALGEVGTLTVPRQILEMPYLAVAALFGSVSLNPGIHADGADQQDARPDSLLGADRLAALLLALFAPLIVVATPNRGESLWIQASMCTVLAVAAVVRMVRAIRSQEVLQSELLERATHDELTGLPSRALILDSIVARLQRPDEVGCVLFLDLDEFKNVNDSMGHGAGDELLILVAERIRNAVRASEIVGRVSGDEFAVVATLHGTDGAKSFGDRIRRVLRDPFRLEHGEVFTSASIGVAVLTGADSDESGEESKDLRTRAADLMQQADTAMYRSKEAGRNLTTVFDSSMRVRVQELLDTERELRHALERGQIGVVYQPIVRGLSGRIEGFEALMRWSVDGRFISPAQFIPVAEKCGLIVPLGTYVLNEACRQVAWWRENIPGAEHCYVSVNLSARQVLSSDIIDVTKQALDEYGLPGDALWLEITESTLIEDTVTTSAVMQGLLAIGVKLAIDDFGTGYSSLSYLKRFPVARVKIDRAFVMGLGQNESDSSLVAAIIAMAHAIGLDTVAEGVETVEQAELLIELGCNQLQGYLFSPGVPPHEVVATMVNLDGKIRRMTTTSQRRCRDADRTV
ncbi:MAG: EAL domain-containing protein [Ilumatobacter sp.]|nr:EAL domain-containing protein [Ilumatobacter sp.]